MQEAIGSPGGGPVDEANQNFMDHDNTKGSDAVVDTTAGKTCIPRFNHEPEAQGYALLGTARGAVIMSNIFLSTALIYLASEEAGCLDEEDKVIDDCDKKIYGFRPILLISNIAVIQGLLSAFFMPVFGAMVDFTPYRRLVGIWASCMIILIQAAQIFTISATWFPMAMLQAIAGFMYQVLILSAYAYLPDIARKVGESTMTHFSSSFTMIQFTAQASFLALVVAIGIGAGLNDVQTAHMSQSINVVWIGLGFWFSWKLIPNAPALHTLGPGRSLLVAGFVENFQTAKSINRHYPNGLRWYLLAVIFAEAAANAFTTVSVVFLNDKLKMSGTEIGIIFFVVLVATLPGSKFGAMVTYRTNPNTSWKLSMVVFSIFTIVGALVLEENVAWLAYPFGVFWGFCLGWFYPTENLFFSMCLPKGKETELAGFFVYCSQILVWCPPLVFTLLVNANIDQKWGLMSIVVFFVIAIGILMMIVPWEEVLEESAKNVDLHFYEDDDDDDDDDAKQEKNESELEIEA